MEVDDQLDSGRGINLPIYSRKRDIDLVSTWNYNDEKVAYENHLTHRFFFFSQAHKSSE